MWADTTVPNPVSFRHRSTLNYKSFTRSCNHDDHRLKCESEICSSHPRPNYLAFRTNRVIYTADYRQITSPCSRIIFVIYLKADCIRLHTPFDTKSSTGWDNKLIEIWFFDLFRSLGDWDRAHYFPAVAYPFDDVETTLSQHCLQVPDERHSFTYWIYRPQTIVPMDISENWLNNLILEISLAVICSFSENIVCTTRGQIGAKQMYNHLVLGFEMSPSSHQSNRRKLASSSGILTWKNILSMSPITAISLSLKRVNTPTR